MSSCRATNANPGLTKRELFAAMAMAGYFGNDRVSSDGLSEVVEWAVGAADALLAELAKPKAVP